MTNPQLLDYVRQQLAAGVSKDAVKKALATQGWNEQDVNEAFSTIERPTSTPITQLPVQTSPTPPQHGHWFGRLLRTIIYTTLGFIIGGIIGAAPPVINYIPETFGMYGLLGFAVLFAVLGTLFAHYLNSRLKISNLTSGRALLAQSWSFYTSHFGTLITIGSLPIVFSLLHSFLPTSILPVTPSLGFSVLILFAVISFILGFLASTATIWFVAHQDTNVGVWGSYKGLIKQIGSVIWISLLNVVSTLGLLVVFLIGAFILAILLTLLLTTLNIPAIAIIIPFLVTGGMIGSFISIFIVGILVSQSVFVLFAEGQRGTQALAQSWLYVRHHINAVLWRFLVLVIPILLPLFLVRIATLFLAVSGTLSVTAAAYVDTYFSLAFSFLFTTPFAAIYAFYLYTSLKNAAPVFTEVDLKKVRRRIRVLSSFGVGGAVIGSVLLFFFISFLLPIIGGFLPFNKTSLTDTSSPSTQGIIADLGRLSTLYSLNDILETYATTHDNKYPSQLSDLQVSPFASSSLPDSILNDPVTGQPHLYAVVTNKTAYTLCTPTSAQEYQCIDSKSGLNVFTFPQESIDAPQESWQVFSDVGGKFSYSFPPLWEQASTTPAGTTAIYLPAATSTLAGFKLAQFSVFEVGVPAGTTLDQTQQTLISSFKQGGTLTDVSSQKTTFKGEPAYVIHFYTAPDGVFVKIYLVQHEGKIYDLYALGKIEQEALVTPTLDKIINSVSF